MDANRRERKKTLVSLLVVLIRVHSRPFAVSSTPVFAVHLRLKNPSRLIDDDDRTTEGGAVLLQGAAVSLECSVVEEIAAGDHQMVLLRIEELKFQPAVNPLVFHGSRFRKLAV